MGGFKTFRYILTAFAFFLTSCASVKVPILKDSPEFKLKVYRKKQIKPCRVVLLPFKNESNDPDAGEKVMLILSSELIRGGIDVVPSGDVKKLVWGAHFFPGQVIPPAFLTLVRLNLKVGLIITGRVVKYRPSGRHGKYPEVAVWFEGIDTQTGTVVFSSYVHNNGGDFRKILDIGVVRSISRLMDMNAKVFVKKLEEAGVKCQK